VNGHLARGREGESLARLWAKHRSQHVGYADAQHPFRLQGSADLNSYKMFAEGFWNLLKSDGRLGVILPTGVYSDFGTKDMRETLLNKGRIDLLYAFQNEKKIFSAADHRFKQVTLFVGKGGHTEVFHTRFRMGVGDSPQAHDIPDDILRNDSAAMVFTPDDVRKNSPNSLSLVELRSPRDLDIFRRIHANAVRIGDDSSGWNIDSSREFHMTDDSRLFRQQEEMKAKGYKPDAFERWISPDGDTALPLYQGRMIGQFDCHQCLYVSGKGPASSWEKIPFDRKHLQPQFLVLQTDVDSSDRVVKGLKIVFMDVANSTNTRTFIGAVSKTFPSQHKAPILKIGGGDIIKILACCSLLNSLVFDYSLRRRMSGLSLGLFILLNDCPLPRDASQPDLALAAILAARLTLIHRRFAPEWLKLKHLYPELASKEWKHWWAVTEADRLRLRVEIDALCADLYGLDSDDFDWIVRDDPTDPKGFYRVDRQLGFRERLTGLTAAAFRALKEGKWSAEAVASLSNDEFFEILGIPELTNVQVAHAKGLPGPLIEKRDGCHVWRPESFPAADPRHGWTWDDCWNDAVALLGNEEAVRSYIEAETKSTKPDKDDGDGPFLLRGDRQSPKQGILF
jgi:hypothetical protein